MFTRALPTTTPSAERATSLTWAGVEMPKPTATGSAVLRPDPGDRLRDVAGNLVAHPVTPSRET